MVRTAIKGALFGALIGIVFMAVGIGGAIYVGKSMKHPAPAPSVTHSAPVFGDSASPTVGVIVDGTRIAL